MKDNITIEVKNLTKLYHLYNKPSDRLKEAIKKGSCYHRDFLAVNDVSFQVKKGETVGIIGKNGAGKSTLLKMITGVVKPSFGNIELSGNVSALLELGAGFDAERNGIENIYLHGRINGLSKKEIDDSVEEILDFADIGDFVYQPIKTYSSGMLVRLAFAAAVNVKPEILIVDEALSVGDVRFQQKCYRKIREFKRNGTVLFVSHDTGAISSFCDRVIWLDEGKIYKEGEPGEIIKEYLAFMRYDVKDGEQNKSGSNVIQDTIKEDDNNSNRFEFGNEMAQYTKIQLLDENGKLISYVRAGQKIILDMEVYAKNKIEFPILGFVIKDKLGNELVATNTAIDDWNVPQLEAENKYKFQWKFTFPEFHADDYPIDIALANGTYQNHEQLHFISDALIIKCIDDHLFQEGRGRYILRDAEFVKNGKI